MGKGLCSWGGHLLGLWGGFWCGWGAKETSGGFLPGTAALLGLVRNCCRLILVCLQHRQSQSVFRWNSLPEQMPKGQGSQPII